jgi:RNA polymerase sigma-70 factor (ECF subfamily)
MFAASRAAEPPPSTTRSNRSPTRPIVSSERPPLQSWRGSGRGGPPRSAARRRRGGVRRTRARVPSVAEEVAQETWLGVLNGLDRFEGRSSLKTWIFRILTNIAKTRAVRDGRTLPFSALQDPARVPEAAVEADRFLDSEHPRWPGHWAVKPAPWPEEALVAGETRERLAEAIEALPATQRAVISLRDIEGWTSEEVRNALDLSETNQRVLLHRARSKVRAALESYLEQA